MTTTDILNREAAVTPLRVPGALVAEFADSAEAQRYAQALGPDYTVTPGINEVWGVRKMIAATGAQRLEQAIADVGGPADPIVVTFRGVTLSFRAGMTMAEIEAWLTARGLEMKATCDGGYTVRTVVDGEVIRAQNLEAKRQQAAHARRWADFYGDQAKDWS